jgi:hypothetical protein
LFIHKHISGALPCWGSWARVATSLALSHGYTCLWIRYNPLSLVMEGLAFIAIVLAMEATCHWIGKMLWASTRFFSTTAPSRFGRRKTSRASDQCTHSHPRTHDQGALWRALWSDKDMTILIPSDIISIMLCNIVLTYAHLHQGDSSKIDQFVLIGKCLWCPRFLINPNCRSN